VVIAGPLFGIDSHAAEHEGEGNATYTRNLIAGLFAEPGDDAFALFGGDPRHAFYGSLPPRPRSGGIGVRQGRGMLRLATLGRVAARARVDCLHVQYAAPFGYTRPLVATVHDLGFLHVPESFPAALRMALRVLVPRTLGRATRIVTGSKFSARDICGRYGLDPGKVTVIPLGASARFHPRPSVETARVLARYGLRPGFLFSLGRLNRRKNLERLLVAYGRLRAAGVSDVPLVIAGKADYGAPGVRRRAQRFPDRERVVFAGMVPDADLPYFYAGAACFVYPSLFEGFGLPVIEAMACGTPIVCSDRAALPELVGEAGLLVDPADVDALADAMARLVGDPVFAAELGERGRAQSGGYSWPETARRTLDVYRAAAMR
jgi:glycosyltransferase involved in cell wall biosynthesis